VVQKENYVTNYFGEANKEKSVFKDLNFGKTHEPEQILRTSVLIKLKKIKNSRQNPQTDTSERKHHLHLRSRRVSQGKKITMNQAARRAKC
jgi:hypothetical protein